MTTSNAEPAVTNGGAELTGSLSLVGNLSVNGNVGIGTDSPTSKLEVKGNLKSEHIQASFLTINGSYAKREIETEPVVELRRPAQKDFHDANTVALKVGVVLHSHEN